MSPPKRISPAPIISVSMYYCLFYRMLFCILHDLCIYFRLRLGSGSEVDAFVSVVRIIIHTYAALPQIVGELEQILHDVVEAFLGSHSVSSFNLKASDLVFLLWQYLLAYKKCKT